MKYPTLQGFPLVYNGLVTNDTFDDDDDDTAVDEHNDTGSSHNRFLTNAFDFTECILHGL